MTFEGKQHILYNLPVVVLGVGESLYRVPGQSSCQPLTLGASLWGLLQSQAQ